MEVQISHYDGEIKISSSFHKNFEIINCKQAHSCSAVYLPSGEIKNVAKQLLLEALAEEDEGFVTDFMLQITQDIAVIVKAGA